MTVVVLSFKLFNLLVSVIKNKIKKKTTHPIFLDTVTFPTFQIYMQTVHTNGTENKITTCIMCFYIFKSVCYVSPVATHSELSDFRAAPELLSVQMLLLRFSRDPGCVWDSDGGCELLIWHKVDLNCLQNYRWVTLSLWHEIFCFNDQ